MFVCFVLSAQVPVREEVFMPFTLHAADLGEPAHMLILSERTWARGYCNDVFTEDCRMQKNRNPTLARSDLINGTIMLKRTPSQWIHSVLLPWYLKHLGPDFSRLFLPVWQYQSEDPAAPPPHVRHLVSLSTLPTTITAPAALLPPLPSAENIPVPSAPTEALTTEEQHETKLRAAAEAMLEENRKTVMYEDGSPVPAEAWKITLPLFVQRGQQVETLLTDDLLEPQSLAQRAMNQRPITDHMVNKLMRSMKDTPKLVKLPEKIGVLLCPTAYDRLNDLTYRGDIFEGLMPDEMAFPADPIKAIQSGERHLIIIAGNHGTVAQLKIVKEAIEENRYDSQSVLK